MHAYHHIVTYLKWYPLFIKVQLWIPTYELEICMQGDINFAQSIEVFLFREKFPDQKTEMEYKYHINIIFKIAFLYNYRMGSKAQSWKSRCGN